MIKVRCVDVSASCNALKIGEVYEAVCTGFNDYLINGIWWSKSRFEIVKDEEQMTHRQKMKELLPIIQAYCDGAEVEKRALLVDDWYTCPEPLFNANHQYRIKQTPDTIDWCHVHKDYKFMARDMRGDVYLFTGKPELNNTVWLDNDHFWTKAKSHSSYKQGTVSWEDSLVERPEGV